MTEDAKAAQRSVPCKHCGRPITDEGYSAPAWWHIHNGSFYCSTVKAEPLASAEGGQP